MKKLLYLQLLSAATAVRAAFAANDSVESIDLEKAKNLPKLVSNLHTDALFSIEKLLEKKHDAKHTDIINSFDEALPRFCFTSLAQCTNQVKEAVRDGFDNSLNRRRQRALNFLSVGEDTLLHNIMQLQQRIEMQDGLEDIVREIHMMEKEMEHSENLNENEKHIGHIILSLALESGNFWNAVEKENRHPMYFSEFETENTISNGQGRKESQDNSIRTKNAVLATLDSAFKSARDNKSRKLESSDLQNLIFQSVPASFHAFRFLLEKHTLEEDINDVLSYSATCENVEVEEQAPQWFVYSIFDMIMAVIRSILELLGLCKPKEPPAEKCIEKVSVTDHIVVKGKLELSNLEVSFSSGNGSIEIAENGNLTMVNCTITNTNYCPDEFTEIDGQCYHVTDNMVKYSQSSAECQGVDSRSYPAVYKRIPKFGLRNLLRSFPISSNSNLASPKTDISVWISRDSSASSCASIDGDIVLTNNAGNCARNPERRVLCVAPLKNPITNNGIYVSESSKFLFTSHQNLARHLADARSVPSINRNSDVTLWKMEKVARQTSRRMNSTEEVTQFVEYTLPDQLPIGIKIIIDLFSGYMENISVASDIHGTSENNTWPLEGNVTLPTKIHLHAEDEVCIKKVAMVLLDDKGGEHETVSISAEALSACLDYNVCSKDNEDQCGRSLMYYDKTNKCAVLDPSDKKLPKDLSLYLNGQECLFLTSWSHSDIGEGFFIEITENNPLRSEDLKLEYLSSEVHNHNATPSGKEKTLVPLKECNQLPLSVSISTEGESQIKGVKILRYDTEIAGVELSNFMNCSSLCDSLVNSDSVILNPENAISMLTVGLIGEKNCAKLSNVETINITGYGDENGEMACTDPNFYNISNSSDLSLVIEQLAASSQFKSVSVVVPQGGLSGPGTVVAAPNRPLFIKGDDAAAFETYITNVDFVVPKDSKMYASRVSFKDNVTFEIENGGVFELVDCSIEVENSHTFLINHGYTSIDNAVLHGNSIISNEAGGYLDLTYVNFEDASMINTSDNSFLSVAHILLHENIDLDGDVTFTYASRKYTILEQTETNCNSSDIPSTSLQIDMKACLEECDKSFFCSGALWWIDSKAIFRCDLCLQEDTCQFDCSHATSYFLKPEEKLQFTAVDGCLYGSREMRTEVDLTFSECRLYCSYFKACGGINFWTDDVTSTCTLYADVDFAECAAGEVEKRIYLDYNESYASDFKSVNGTLIESSELAMHEMKDANECSAICSKTIQCESFVLDEDNCVLYSSRSYMPVADVSPLYILVTDIYPKKRYMSGISKQISGEPLASSKTKTKSRCMNHCNSDHHCTAFSYISSLSESKNCFLYDQTATLVESEEGLVNAETAYGYDAFIPTTSRFVEEEQIREVLLEECKTFCLNNVECIALRFFHGTEENNNTDTICYLGDVEYDAKEQDELSLEETNTAIHVSQTDDFESSVAMFLPVFDENATYVLSAISFHFATRYENTRSCSTNKILDTPSFETEISSGYAKFERACIKNPSYATDSPLAPAKCANVCDNMQFCNGYVHYKDYAGANNLEKEGLCEFITTDDISFDDCDGTENNMDVYLRGDIGLTCEAACSLDPECVSFTFNSTNCELYSDIGLVEVEENCDVMSVNVKTDYRSRGNMMTVANNTCLVDESLDFGEIGCYGNFTGSSADLLLQDDTNMSQILCRDSCAANQMEYYAITNGDSCYCFDTFEIFSNLTSATCTSQCTGDPGQICGGPEEATMGETLLPILNVTRLECMDECLGTSFCKSATYDDDNAVCQLYSVSASDVCSYSTHSRSMDTEKTLLQKSCPGRFYEKAEAPFSYEVFHKDFKALQQDCEKLCMMFGKCKAIRYDQSQLTQNCELLYGNFLEQNNDYDLEPDVWIVRTLVDHIMYPEHNMDMMRSLSSKSVIASYPDVYHFDQCNGLCESNIRCGSFVYQTGSICTLFDRSQSFKLETSTAKIKSDSSKMQRYVSVKELFDDSYHFSEMPSNYCVSGGKTIEQPKTVTSIYACGVRCYNDEDCDMFTTSNIPEFKCWLHYSGTLSADCDDDVGKTIYSLHMQNDNILTSENSRSLSDSSVIARYNDISRLDCVGICQKTDNCKSCSHDKGVCSITEGRGSTYQEGTFKFRPVGKSCISETNEGKIFPKRDFSDCLTLCSRLNDIGECDTFEHSIDGDCTIYTDDDDSCKSSSDDDSSNLYTYVKGAQAQPTGRITTDGVEGQFEVWLSTGEGYQSLHLRADVMAMNNLAEVNTARILDIIDLVDRSSDLLETIYNPVESLASLVSLGETISWAIKTGCNLIKNVPYVGPIAQTLYITFNLAYNVFDKGDRVLEKAPEYLDRVLTPLESFQEKLESGVAIIVETTKSIMDSVESITRGLFFAKRSQNTVFGNTLISVVNVLAIAVENLSPTVSGLSGTLSVLDGLKSDLDLHIVGVIDGINHSFGGVFQALESFRWLETVIDHEIKFSMPDGVSYGFPFSLTILWKEYRISIRGIGDFVDTIKSKIMGIPGVGLLWETAEGIINTVIEAIFAAIGITIPEIGIKFGFMDTVYNDVVSATNDLVNMEQKFSSFLNVKDLSSKMTEAQNAMVVTQGKAHQIKNKMREMKDCNSNTCLVNKVGAMLEIILPALSQVRERIMPVDRADFESMRNFFDKVDLDKFYSSFSSALDGGIVCNDSVRKVADIDFVQQLLKDLNLEGVSLPTVPIPFVSCNSFSFANEEVFRTELTTIFNGIEVTGSTGGGYSFPIPVPTNRAMSLATKYSAFIYDVTRNFSVNKDRVMKDGIENERTLIDLGSIKLTLKMNNAFDHFDVIVGKSNEALTLVSPPFYTLKLTVATSRQEMNTKLLNHYGVHSSSDKSKLEKELKKFYNLNFRSEMQRCYAIQAKSTLYIYYHIVRHLRNELGIKYSEEMLKHRQKYDSYMTFRANMSPSELHDGNRNYGIKNMKRMKEFAKEDWTYRTSFMEIINFAAENGMPNYRGQVARYAYSSYRYPDDDDKLCSGYSLDELDNRKDVLQQVVNNVETIIPFSYSTRSDERILSNTIPVGQPWFKFLKKVSGHAIDARKIRDPAIKVKAFKKYYFGDLHRTKTYSCALPSMSLPLDFQTGTVDEVLSNFGDTFSWLPECQEYRQETVRLDTMSLPRIGSFHFTPSRRVKSKTRAIRKHVETHSSSLSSFPAWYDEGFEMIVKFGDIRMDVKTGETTTFADNSATDYRFCSNTDQTSGVLGKFCINYDVLPFTPSS